MSIDEVARDTRISPRFLEALEAEQFHELPAPVYVRGFLRSYANYLHIEAQPLLDRLVGGAMAAPGAREDYIAGNGTNGKASARRNDPFQRGGVVAATAPVARPKPQPDARRAPVEDDSWAPEPPAAFTPPHVDHGYIPGSDLLEAPERVHHAAEPEPVFQRRRTAGVLAERPPAMQEPGVPRRLLVFGGAVLGILGFLALAVLLTRDDGDGTNQADASDAVSGGATPGTVIPIGGAAGTATAAASGGSPTSVASASPSAAGETATTGPTTVPAANSTTSPGTATATATPTTAAPPTPVPTATPTSPPPTATPTFAPPPHPITISACDTTRETEKCGSSNVRVICFPPFAETDPTGRNNNYFVDVTGAYPLQPGWRETTVFAPVSIGPVIDAGRSGCS